MSILDKVTKKTPAKKAVAKKTEAKAAAPAPKAKASRSLSKHLMGVIKGPVISEKAAHLGEDNVIVLRVNKDANKVSVRNAIRELYNITPVRVNIVNIRGQKVTSGRYPGARSNYKKALVKLPKGATLDIFEGV